MTAQRIFKQVKAKGFTLIELLVVIGILGILATALIATIDPFEQLKKANDSNTKNITVEFLNSNLRYYTTHSAMPWAATAGGGFAGCGDQTEPNSGSVVAPGMILSTLNGNNCILGLIADGELKSSFTNASGILDDITILGTPNAATACYLPTSKSGQKDPQTHFSALGVATAGCKSANPPGTTDCFYCIIQ